MRNCIRPLVVTPTRKNSESFRDFILRTSEMNGYVSPGDMLRTAGMTENEIRSVRLPLLKLMPLFGKNAEQIKAADYGKEEEGANGTIRILNHAVPSMYLGVKEQKICHKCVSETGYIDAFWDLRMATVCPVHETTALTHCPQCGKKISWFRPGLLQCVCGGVLKPTLHETYAKHDHLALLDAVWLKLHNEPIASERLFLSGFPIEQFERMSLSTLLGVIERFANLGNKYSKYSVTGVENELDFACMALKDWPNGFYSFLEQTAHHKNLHRGPAGLAKQFSGFQQAFLHAALPGNEIAFIWDAFAEFGKTRWKKALIDPKLKGAGHAHSEVVGGVMEVARRIGVRRTTVHKLVELGILEVMRVERDGGQRLLFDMTQALPMRTTQGASLSAREAARRLQIPVSVLEALRQKRVFKTKWLGIRIASFHEWDVEGFYKMVMSHVCELEANNRDDSGLVTLKQVMNKRVGSSVAKADVIITILEGRLTAYKAKKGGIGHVLVNQSEIDALLKVARISELDALCPTHAAQELGCSPLIIDWLLENGFLNKKLSYGKNFITKRSIMKFKDKYRFCSQVAKQMCTSTRGVVNRCHRIGIDLMVAFRRGGVSGQPFMRNDDLEKLYAKNIC